MDAPHHHHPRLLITADDAPGLRSVADARAALKHGHARRLWQLVLAATEADRAAEPIVPSSPVPGRAPQQVETANRDYAVVEAAGQRVLRAAFAAQMTGDHAHVDTALRQIEVLFDETAWPDWRDLAHLSAPADLRTGMLARDLSLAYDWMHGQLDDAQRRWIVDGLHRRAILPFWASVEQGARFTHGPRMNNWHTVICGGLGIAGMALGEDHPDSAQLIAFADALMEQYLSVYGPEGEFNESPGYANATAMPVGYFTVQRYHTRGAINRLAEWPFPQTCRWMAQQYLPPGRMAAYGDTKVDAAPRLWFFAAVADATGDRDLQAIYLHHSRRADHPEPLRALLAYNPQVLDERASHTIGLPTGRAFHAHSQCITSRSSWNLDAAATVVYGKGGHGQEGHGHHDAGQLCIDAAGERLIVDLGTPYYPADYFGPNRYEYYFASVRGHNVPMFDGEEITCDPERRAVVEHAEFDESGGGGAWMLDLTALYEGVVRVRRRVVHLDRVVAVLDEAELPVERAISLRWHTADAAEPDADGRFTVMAGQASLAGRVVHRGEGAIRIARGEHRFEPPFDRDRLGYPLPQDRPSYIEASLRARSCRLLSMFCTSTAHEPPGQWEEHRGIFRIATGPSERDHYCVALVDDAVQVSNDSTGISRRV